MAPATRGTTAGPAVVGLEPLPATKRAQVVLAEDGAAAAFAGVVHPEVPYGAEARFWCPRGHVRLDPSCQCGFYAVDGDRPLPPSLVLAATCEVELAGRVVRHPECLRGELIRVLRVVVDRWCAWCTGHAVGLAPVASGWATLPPGWRRALPLCVAHASAQDVVVVAAELASLLGTEVAWSDNPTSRAAVSLQRARRAWRRRPAAMW